MTGPAILLMIAAILLVWGGLCGSTVALKIMTPPFEKGESYEDQEVASPSPGLSEADFRIADSK